MTRRSDGMSLEEMTREIYDRVVGDGTEDNPGLDKRVDRLEGLAKSIKWVIGTTAALMIASAWAWFTGKGGK